MTETKKCKGCEKVLPFSDFSKNAYDKPKSKCKKCVSAKGIEYYKAKKGE